MDECGAAEDERVAEEEERTVRAVQVTKFEGSTLSDLSSRRSQFGRWSSCGEWKAAAHFWACETEKIISSAPRTPSNSRSNSSSSSTFLLSWPKRPSTSGERPSVAV